ncbi:hypothetical protein B5F40_09910 [Gordonibacter sp. An230]|uniref:epoxyqueuosine reductase QueH n=1 Tax=Gordonibacter sp. An230 TaxID=1965592 RepID=UPI000B3A674F|nr:epoxyqueuosine reductase QueH [Gordonibacter sp. An230]OUO89696.1 hypothetical protein B5F40_09910 [Gordonibacter sp. An230]
MKLLLHACCGPCSLEPVRILRAEGHDLAIHYANSNIAPAEEHARRLATLRAWADGEGLPVLEGPYDPATWEACAGRVGEAALSAVGGDVLRLATEEGAREARCRACYRLRLSETARTAAEQGFDGVGTTLSVSPYQFSDVIREELVRAAADAGVRAVFEDFRPFYDEAVRRSRALGMYRQNYCGCRFSQAEAEAERVARKKARAAERAAAAEARAAEQADAAAERAARKAERAAYDAKQARKRAVLKALREQRRGNGENE